MHPNKIYIGDNLPILQNIPDKSINLILTDPPYMTGQNFGDYKDIFIDGVQFVDNDIDTIIKGLCIGKSKQQKQQIRGFINFMYPRLLEARRVLTDNGSIFLMCDYNTHHIIRVLVDYVVGEKNFLRALAWSGVNNTISPSKNKFQKTHDVIYHFSKEQNKNAFYHKYKDYSKASVERYISPTGTLERKQLPKKQQLLIKYYEKKYYKGIPQKVRSDDRGIYSLSGCSQPVHKGYYYKLGMGEETPRDGYMLKEHVMRGLIKKGRIVITKGQTPRVKSYMNDGALYGDTIKHIKSVGNTESIGYATEKPYQLFHHLIAHTTKKDDVVLDMFAGSGITAVVCATYEDKPAHYIESTNFEPRRFIIIDMNPILPRNILKKYTIMKGTTSTNIFGNKQTTQDLNHDKAKALIDSMPMEEVKKQVEEKLNAYIPSRYP